MRSEKKSGSFTLPGESGYEELTLKLAEKWGADAIRDSDGTVLSDAIVNTDYCIYSTICIIRDHNAWAKENPQCLQQCFLITKPKVAAEKSVRIPLMEDFFAEQFRINASADAMKYWQVYDRTTGQEINREKWSYDEEEQAVIILQPTLWHKYTVSFMVFRIWEEISMYNHTTNHWEKEHLMQLDPVHRKTQDYLLTWLENYCIEHRRTSVIRFTSLFYNFAWIWGSSERNRYLFSDWGSYDFTVSPLALDEFAKKYGYSLTAEDFVNEGKYQVSHMPADRRKLDWMEYVNDFVINFGKQLIDIVHKYNKLAYVFYDDSWVGMEPYNGRFQEFGFDGLIKCVFSGFEVRLCSEVEIATHELRLHPYLFPIGLGGAPTFMEGGDPASDAIKYWVNIRRALLRTPVERIGLGGYLHLVDGFPEFCDCIENIAREFRLIKELHLSGRPYELKAKVAVLHSWGSLRSWTLSGHFHETYMHDLIHVNEALSGLPVSVSFISFEDIKQGVFKSFDVVINAGASGTAWSGGEAWKDPEVVEKLTEWVYEGGRFLGINEPSAVEGFDTCFRMAHVLGIDKDTGARVSHGKWSFDVLQEKELLVEGSTIKPKENMYLTDGEARVLAAEEGKLMMTSYSFGQGLGIYLSSFRYTPDNTRLLLNLLQYGDKVDGCGKYLTDNPLTECAYYPESRTLYVINNSNEMQKTAVDTDYGRVEFELEPYSYQIYISPSEVTTLQ